MNHLRSLKMTVEKQHTILWSKPLRRFSNTTPVVDSLFLSCGISKKTEKHHWKSASPLFSKTCRNDYFYHVILLVNFDYAICFVFPVKSIWFILPVFYMALSTFSYPSLTLTRRKWVRMKRWRNSSPINTIRTVTLLKIGLDEENIKQTSWLVANLRRFLYKN